MRGGRRNANSKGRHHADDASSSTTLGQSLWLDNITRDLLTTGTLRRYIAELSVTGLTSNPTIFDQAIKDSTRLRRGDPREARGGQVRRSALLRAGARGPRHELPICSGRSSSARTASTAGCRSKSRRCSRTTRRRPSQRRSELHAQAGRPQPLHQDPGTKRRTARDRGGDLRRRADQRDAAVFARSSISRAAEAYLRGVERRIAAGLNPDVASVASIFISRWDVAVAGKVPAGARQPARHRHRPARLQGLLRACIASPRQQRAMNAGARLQRLLLASTGTKDPKASDILYIKALAAPLTINTMPEGTLKALRRPRRDRAADARRWRRLRGGARASSRRPAWTSTRSRRSCRKRARPRSSSSWSELMNVIASKSAALEAAK